MNTTTEQKINQRPAYESESEFKKRTEFSGWYIQQPLTQDRFAKAAFNHAWDLQQIKIDKLNAILKQAKECLMECGDGQCHACIEEIEIMEKTAVK